MRTILLLVAVAPTVFAQRPTPPDSARSRRDTTRTLETVTVSAIRARDEAPISAKILTAHELQKRSFGQDIPLLLQGTPSFTAYSETGSHWGYSYFRLRGIDQSRINLTIDGIPLNDPEDQVLYFADFPDLANSIQSVQIQRGVGTSTLGTASYGGSINFETIPVASTPRAAEVQLQTGSFGSHRASAEYASGLTASRVAMYGRVSALRSQGYRRHSGMEGRSAFLSAAYVGDNEIVKFTGTAGLFADTLAYVGATPTELALDRRFNPLRPDEVDRFGEQIGALSYTRLFSEGSFASATAYRISASGNYDVCISSCDQPVAELWNFHLDFVWYGATAAWNLERGRMRASLGANANTYARDHHAYARPNTAEALYLNTGHKEDATAFAKLSYDAGRITLYGDLQSRRARFRYEPDTDAGIPPASIAWTFVNPKVGATLRVTPAAIAYVSFGLSSREPARSDMLGGFDNLDTSNVAFVGPLTRVRPERVHDTEVGVRMQRESWSVEANAFVMQFHNEILPVGRLTYIGTPLRANVGSSFRRGLELDATARPITALTLGVSATAMQARIAEFTDDETGLIYEDVEPLLSPKFVSAASLTLQPSQAFRLSGIARYSSRAQLNNTGNATLTLPGHMTADLGIAWERESTAISVHLNNATHSRRYGGGHVSFGEPRYYVLPPRSLFVQARVGW